MTWNSHRITSFCLTYTLTGSFGFAGASVLFSTLPDRLESVHHRGISHNIVAWIIISTMLWMLSYILAFFSLSDTITRLVQSNIGIMVTVSEIWKAFVISLLAGVFSHLFTDGLSTSGVPVCPGSKLRFKGALYKTWKTSEYIVVAIIVFLAFAAYLFYWK